jgi:hypothetical protein
MIRHSLVRKIAHDMTGQLRKSLEAQQDAILAYVAEELEEGREESEPVKITVSMTYEIQRK